MSMRSWLRRIRRALPAAGTTAVLVAGLLVGGATASQAATQGPCDIYAAGGTPCVAAHSTTRALFASYSGPLYQVQRTSDGRLQDIGMLAAGGVADAGAQDSFCAGTACTITRVYDQTGGGNTLVYQGPGGTGGADSAAVANTEALSVGGRKAYALYINPGNSYFAYNPAGGVPTGSSPEGEYMVTSGTHVNGGCCFDYGNTEIDHKADGNGAMDAINFGTECWFGGCSGTGPWVQADLENGLFSGGSKTWNTAQVSQTSRFVTAMLKNDGTARMALKGADARSGGLTQLYSGTLPGGWSPMHKQGAVILGSGGDCCQTNRNASAGTFYEGAMVKGYPSDATDAAVQANIAAAGYSTDTTNPFVPGAKVSLQATTSCCTGDYLRHDTGDDRVVIAPVTSGSSAVDKGNATWIVRAGLADSSCVSFESADTPGRYLRHYAFQLHLQADAGTGQFAADATFCAKPGNSGTGYSLQSFNFPAKYIRHYRLVGYIAGNGGTNAWDNPSSWAQDTSWLAAAPWS
ncbi:alpha-L-arabinofuranosidase B [Kitasatospora atroaurantiaca]|uniref:Alpha-L-arabinofuranosidase B-like protein n=1 Tax=Kitasatospora atroaurantiaca TaxID=285545 RepID=A0A561F088_9ACTN|nr:alpha-L-arabinofuranosidase B [Kitasatospora atroaurantiaca]TWE21280.1 alpha-L-arabinofuranosidase B-like protein [Kitasatospora atroaurantiaca]